MQIAASELRHHHFSFVRAVLEGIPLRRAWMQYLAFEGGPDDERHFQRRFERLARQIHLAAEQRGLSAEAGRALSRYGESSPCLPRPALPSLDEWIAQQCEALGIDVDFQSQAEWLAEYEAALGLDQPSPPMPATALPPAAEVQTVRQPLESLNRLAGELARPPALTDDLSAWLSPGLAAQLQRTEVDGRILPLLTLGDLIDFINLRHHRWWTCVPRLGRVRAERLVAWLVPLAIQMARPLHDGALKPFALRALRRSSELDVLDPATVRHYGLVPLDRLAVPESLDGRTGLFRNTTPNVLGAHTDLEAIHAWLQRHAASPRTHASYRRIAERFYLWCVWVRRKPMSSLTEADYQSYRAFLAAPPADWVQRAKADRHSSEWRPLKRPLSLSSQKLNFSVISAMLTELVEAGYLNANAARGVLPSMKLPHFRIDIERSFSDGQWQWLMRCWNELYAAVGPADDGGPPRLLPDASHPDRAFPRAASLRRTRLVLELGATTGLRLIELVTTRRGALVRQQVDGQAFWFLRIVGKGNRNREALLHDDIKALLDQHHLDMKAAETAFDARNPRVRTLRAPDASAAPGNPATRHGYQDADDALPLVGALRKSPPRWKLDARGLPVLDRTAPQNADRFGSLDPTALHQSLKRFFHRCADLAEVHGIPLDTAALRRASTHWLRHFFANSAAADNVSPAVLMNAMGHASLQTTSVYLHTERKPLVEELSKMKRR
jgi:site-specific recombinase XerD